MELAFKYRTISLSLSKQRNGELAWQCQREFPGCVNLECSASVKFTALGAIDIPHLDPATRIGIDGLTIFCGPRVYAIPGIKDLSRAPRLEDHLEGVAIDILLIEKLRCTD